MRAGLACLSIAALGGCAYVPPPPSHVVAQWSQFRLNPQNNVVLPGDLATAWSVETHGPISSSPSLVDGTLFVGNNKGALLAIDAASGRVRWREKLLDALMSAPLAIGGNVIVGEGNEMTYVDHGVVHVGGGSNAIVALDRKTGALRWRTHLGGTAMPTGAYVGGRLLAHVGNGDLVALAPEDGKVAFARNMHAIPSMVSLLPVGNDLVVTAGQTETQVVAAHASTGAVEWRAAFPNSSALGDGPLVTDGRYVMGGYLFPPPPEPYVKATHVNEQRIFALDARTGKRVWDVHIESGVTPYRNQSAIPLVDGGKLFIGSAIAPAMHALDIATGKTLWRRAVDGPVKGGIVAAHGNVYFGDFSGHLWALRENDGSVAGVLNAGTPFNVGSPIIDGETLMIGSITGRMIALPLAAFDGATDLAAAKSVATRWFSPPVLAAFRADDRNHDGFLSHAEFPKALASGDFAAVDRNGDGRISPFEFAVAAAPKMPGLPPTDPPPRLDH